MNESIQSTVPVQIDDTLYSFNMPKHSQMPSSARAESTSEMPYDEVVTSALKYREHFSFWKRPDVWGSDLNKRIFADREHAAFALVEYFSDALREWSVQFDVKPEYSETSYFDEQVITQSKQILAEVTELFTVAESMKIEAGMENNLSLGLRQMIAKYGEIAFGHIEGIILSESLTISLARETLKYIGSFEMSTWCDERRELLERCLRRSRYAWIRDGAGLGLSFMDDPESIPVLKEAIEEETNSELKEDLVQVLEQLEETLLESF